MSTTKWIGSARSGNSSGVDLMTTELNSLGSGSQNISATAIQNDTDQDLFCDFELTVTFAVAPTSGQPVDLYIVRRIDATNFEDGSSSFLPKNGYVGTFYVRAVTTAQRIVIPNVILPPRTFHTIVVNRTSQAFPASGSKLRGYFYNYQSS